MLGQAPADVAVYRPTLDLGLTIACYPQQPQQPVLGFGLELAAAETKVFRQPSLQK